MKRMLAMVLALALAIPMMTVTAFAEGGKKKDPKSGTYQGGETEVSPGDEIEVDTDWFYGTWTIREENDEGKRVNVKYDTEDEPIGSLDKEYHKVSATWTRGGDYVQSVYFEDGDGYVTVEIKGGISMTADKEISGTIKIVQKDVPNMPDTTFTCKIERGDLVVKGIDEKSRMIYLGDKEFGLPDDYQEKQVRFSTDEGEDYGTFIGEFYGDRSGQDVATFRVRIIDQGSLYLGFSEASNSTLLKKYPNANMRFINWTARPTFDREGKLSIYMEPDEYIYGVKDDNTLYRLGGTYDENNDAYVITTKTLGCYVISDTQLSATAASGNSGTGGNAVAPSSSTAPKPSSSVAPSSVAPPPSSSVAPPPSSSVAPPPSSSVAPPPSSSEVIAPPPSSEEEPSSDPDEESSDPGEDDPDEDEDDEKDRDKDDDEDGEDKEKEKKGFPLVPVLLGVLGIVIIVCAVVVVGNRSNSSQRSRRRRYDDDWDD